MEKKKTIVCTIIFAILLIAVMIGSFCIESEDGRINLGLLFGCLSYGWYIGTRIEKFYKWLTN